MAVTIVKEDGTGLANANSYATLAEAEIYLENTGRKDTGAWVTASADQKNAALIQGTDYLDQIYRRRYRGEIFSTTQRLEWPRNNLVDALGAAILPADIPEAIGNATIEYAVEAVSGALAPTPQFDDTGNEIKSKFEKVDVLEERTVYRDKAPRRYKPFPRAELVIRQWLKRANFGLTARI